MKVKELITAIIVGFAMLALVAAQSPTTSERQNQPSPQGEKMKMMDNMSMDQMMKECRKHCEATANSIGPMMSMMKEASQSNDPAKMRAALDAAQKPLSEMKNRMSMCMNMMDRMEKMRGGMKGMMQDDPGSKKSGKD